MGFRIRPACQGSAQTFDRRIGKGRRHTVESDETNHAGHFQYMQTVTERNAYKGVAGKQRKLHSVPPIPPTPYRLIEGHEGFHGLPRQLFGHTLFVPRPSKRCVPSRLETGDRESRLAVIGICWYVSPIHLSTAP